LTLRKLVYQFTATHCNTLQHTATYCNTLLEQRGGVTLTLDKLVYKVIRHGNSFGETNFVKGEASAQFTVHAETNDTQIIELGRSVVRKCCQDCPQLGTYFWFILCKVSAAHCSTQQHTVTQRSTLLHTAAHCNTLQHTAAHSSTQQHTATHCSTLQHTAAHCSTLQHTATHCIHCQDSPLLGTYFWFIVCKVLTRVLNVCKATAIRLQHTATHCNTPLCAQHTHSLSLLSILYYVQGLCKSTATHCNTLL